MQEQKHSIFLKGHGACLLGDLVSLIVLFNDEISASDSVKFSEVVVSVGLLVVAKFSLDLNVGGGLLNEIVISSYSNFSGNTKAVY